MKTILKYILFIVYYNDIKKLNKKPKTWFYVDNTKTWISYDEKYESIVYWRDIKEWSKHIIYDLI